MTYFMGNSKPFSNTIHIPRIILFPGDTINKASITPKFSYLTFISNISHILFKSIGGVKLNDEIIS